jgi:hypothetical protein
MQGKYRRPDSPRRCVPLVARARPFESDPPAVQGTCGCCTYRGPVYAGRYGGHRCTLCFGLQTLEAHARRDGDDAFVRHGHHLGVASRHALPCRPITDP